MDCVRDFGPTVTADFNNRKGAGVIIFAFVLCISNAARAQECPLETLHKEFDLQPLISGDPSSVPTAVATLTFARSEGLVSIEEIVETHMASLDDFIRASLRSELADLPDDACGAAVELTSLRNTAANGDAKIVASFDIQVSVCEFGLAATVAEGPASLTAMMSPKVSDGRLSFTSNVAVAHDIATTLDAFFIDSDAIEAATADALEHASSRIHDALEELNNSIATMQTENKESLEIGPIYRPMLVKAAFVEGDSQLALQTVRQVQVRAGTACTINTQLKEKFGA